MRLLLTGDWQAGFMNLEQCQIALQELLRAAKKYQPDAIVHTGDLKDTYNPVDVRVMKFWITATRAIRQAGFRFIVLLGNHDRISQSLDAQNWLSVVRVAGAEVASMPKVVTVGDGELALLPFSADRDAVKSWAKGLSCEIRGGSSVLIFHHELLGARLNSAGVAGRNGFDPEELYCSSYVACFGGHLHGHQKLGENIWYVGSPFCQDWGEANESKGHVYWDSADGRVRQLRTRIPHWYDVEWLREHNREPEEGAYLRSRVAVTSKKITQQMQDEEHKIEVAYGSKMHIFVVPQIVEGERGNILLDGSDDEARVSQYVAAAWPEQARFKPEQAVEYIVEVLEKTGAVRRGRKLRFKRIEAANVLSFKEVWFRYAKQGVVLVRGSNRDWPKRSNGSGKTNLLSLLTVALSGRSTKEQVNDRWKNERTNGPAVVKLLLVDEQGRNIEIERERPHKIRLLIDGKDESSGIRGKAKIETQGMIEQVTGFDYDMLMNSVYIDQSISNGFLFGAQKARMDLIAKLENLERYDAALAIVNKAIKANAKARLEYENQAERLEESLAEVRAERAALGEHHETAWAAKLVQARTEMRRLTAAHASYSEGEKVIETAQAALDDITHDLNEARRRLWAAQTGRDNLEQQRLEYARLATEGICWVCGQAAKVAGETQERAFAERVKTQQRECVKWTHSVAKLELQEKDQRAKLVEYRSQLREVEVALAAARENLAAAEAGEKEEARHNAQLKDRLQGLQEKQYRLQRTLKAAANNQRTCDLERELLEFAYKAFQRSGMPLYLSAALCPVLNNAAEEYSQLFFGGRSKVHFSVDEGEFNVEIVNGAGSDRAEGQSVGEAAMAGIVTAFALREAAPRTNLLILDEPGHGLDPEGARQFAEGLLRLKDRFETVLVTTHHPAIEAVLQGEHIWTVEKRKGISTLIQ